MSLEEASPVYILAKQSVALLEGLSNYTSLSLLQKISSYAKQHVFPARASMSGCLSYRHNYDPDHMASSDAGDVKFMIAD